MQTSEEAKGVELKKVDVSFESTVKTAWKWLGALVLIAAVVGVIWLIASEFLEASRN